MSITESPIIPERLSLRPFSAGLNRLPERGSGAARERPDGYYRRNHLSRPAGEWRYRQSAEADGGRRPGGNARKTRTPGPGASICRDQKAARSHPSATSIRRLLPGIASCRNCADFRFAESARVHRAAFSGFGDRDGEPCRDRRAMTGGAGAIQPDPHSGSALADSTGAGGPGRVAVSRGVPRTSLVTARESELDDGCPGPLRTRCGDGGATGDARPRPRSGTRRTATGHHCRILGNDRGSRSRAGFAHGDAGRAYGKGCLPSAWW